MITRRRGVPPLANAKESSTTSADKYMRWADYDRSWNRYCQIWKGFDEALYRLCVSKPGHEVLSEIVAKVGLISRAYVAGLERHGEEKGEKAIVATARTLWKRHARLDAALNRLRHIAGTNEPLSVDFLRSVVRVHSRFLNVVRAEMREGDSVRSFISKYIHFHVPAVPMYDSQARALLARSYPLTDRQNRHFELPAGADPEYHKFCNRFYSLWRDATARGLPVSVRRLDQHLRRCFEKLKEEKGKAMSKHTVM